MKNFLRVILVTGFFILQGCQHAGENQNQNLRKVDLEKAASYNVQLGLGYLKQGDRPRAKKKLLSALDQAPGSADVNAAMAYYFEQTNELSDARKYYLKALSLSANSGAQLNNYGTFLCRQGDYKKADEYFLKAVKDSHYLNTAAAYENAGLCALSIPDENKAKSHFASAIKQDPSRRMSLYELVKLEMKGGREKEAYDLIQNHPDLVLNDKVFLSLAKDVANKIGNNTAAAQYEELYNKIGLVADNSGVNDEYNKHNG